MSKLKKGKKVLNFLFKVPATPEGLAFIKQARTMLNPDCKFELRPNGPRQKARALDDKTCINYNGEEVLDQNKYNHYLPIRHATEIRVYLKLVIPSPERSDFHSKWHHEGTQVTLGPWGYLSREQLI